MNKEIYIRKNNLGLTEIISVASNKVIKRCKSSTAVAQYIVDEGLVLIKKGE
jgi:hypothetical protein